MTPVHTRLFAELLVAIPLVGCVGDASTDASARGAPDAASGAAVVCRATLLYKPVPQNDLWVRVGEPVDVAPMVDTAAGAGVVQVEPATDARGDGVYLSLEVLPAPSP